MLALAASSQAAWHAPYRSCLVFVDDAKNPADMTLAVSLGANALPRSWYRFGAPPPEKAYERRADFVRSLSEKSLALGGGISLSVLAAGDLRSPEFREEWLARELDGSVHEDAGRRYGSLSAPGFRAYLVARALEQAKLGVVELHLGEPHGKLLYDDWTLGLRGNRGLLQWLARRHAGKDQAWWRASLGEAGKALATGKPVTRAMLAGLDARQQRVLEQARGDAWKGTDAEGRPAFLAEAARSNLQDFIEELRAALQREGLEGVAVDVWGFAPWMKDLSPRPDAFLTSPPDERWGLSWNTDPEYPVENQRARLKELMLEHARFAAPNPVLYMFDHPSPFHTAFVRLPDARQAFLTRFFDRLAAETGAQFVFRAYAGEGERPGPLTLEAIKEGCRRRRSWR